MNKSILTPRVIILIGLFIRILVIPFTLNWDLWANTRLAVTFDLKKLEEFYQQPLAAYPPASYIILKSSLDLITRINGSSFSNWLNESELSSITHPFLYRFLFFIKLPYLIAEIACALVFVSLIKSRQKLKAYLLWWWNPVIIFLVYAWTNIDIFFILFILLSLKAHQSGRLLISVVLMSLGIIFKILPVFFLPFLVLSIPQNSEKLKAAFISMVIIILGHIPVFPVLATYLNHSVLGGYRDQVLFAVLAIGQNRFLIFVYLFYFLLLFSFIQLQQEVRQNQLFAYYFGVLAVIFAFSRFNLPWFLWLVPFLNLIIIKLKRLRLYSSITYGVFFLLIIFSQASWNIGMLSPLEPSLWRIDYPLKEIMGQTNLVTLLNTLQTIFSAAMLFTSFQLLTNKEFQLT